MTRYRFKVMFSLNFCDCLCFPLDPRNRLCSRFFPCGWYKIPFIARQHCCSTNTAYTLATLLWELVNWHSSHHFLPFWTNLLQWLCTGNLYLQRHMIQHCHRRSTLTAPSRRMLPEDLYAVRAKREHLILRLIRLSRSPWASPFYVVRLLTITRVAISVHSTVELYVTVTSSHTSTISPTVCRVKDFSRSSILWAYYHTPFAFEDIPKTAITTPWPMRVRLNGSWFAKFSSNIPEVHVISASWSQFCLVVYWWCARHQYKWTLISPRISGLSALWNFYKYL